MKKKGSVFIFIIIFSLLPSLIISTELDKFQKALTFLDLKEYKKANAIFFQIKSDDPGFLNIDRFIALTFINDGAPCEAIKYLGKTLKMTVPKRNIYDLWLLYAQSLARCPDDEGLKDVVGFVKRNKTLINNQDGQDILRLASAISRTSVFSNKNISNENKKEALSSVFELIKLRKCENEVWFWNTMGLANIARNDFENDASVRIDNLCAAITCFENETKINPSSIVYGNMALTHRLVADEVGKIFTAEIHHSNRGNKQISEYLTVRYHHAKAQELFSQSEKQADFNSYKNKIKVWEIESNKYINDYLEFTRRMKFLNVARLVDVLKTNENYSGCSSVLKNSKGR